MRQKWNHLIKISMVFVAITIFLLPLNSYAGKTAKGYDPLF